ncbi:hypothetical protein EV426DRAFT_591782 [Tirmania nivea]|nr:hypothetical protein EV426DRAFT_591782 [Tirmania nivea]
MKPLLVVSPFSLYSLLSLSILRFLFFFLLCLSYFFCLRMLLSIFISGRWDAGTTRIATLRGWIAICWVAFSVSYYRRLLLGCRFSSYCTWVRVALGEWVSWMVSGMG